MGDSSPADWEEIVAFASLRQAKGGFIGSLTLDIGAELETVRLPKPMQTYVIEQTDESIQPGMLVDADEFPPDASYTTTEIPLDEVYHKYTSDAVKALDSATSGLYDAQRKMAKRFNHSFIDSIDADLTGSKHDTGSMWFRKDHQSKSTPSEKEDITVPIVDDGADRPPLEQPLLGPALVVLADRLGVTRLETAEFRLYRTGDVIVVHGKSEGYPDELTRLTPDDAEKLVTENHLGRAVQLLMDQRQDN